MNASEGASVPGRSTILVISPTPTHRTNRGNRVRILNVCQQLERWGYEVHFLHVRMQGGDHEAMLDYWGPRYHWADYTKPLRSERFLEKWLRRARQIVSVDARYAVGVDDWYSLDIDDAIVELANRYRFDVVIVNYVFLSKALLRFGDCVLKLIDTHNLFAFRHRMLLRHGIKPYFFSTTEIEEGKGLSRADVVIGIQEMETKRFSEMVEPGVRVITVGHLNAIARLGTPKPSMGSRMLFVGSDSPINASGAAWFISECLPIVRQELPEAEMLVAGRVCTAIPDAPGVRKLGEVADLREAYLQADVAINPVRTGTGLNIKSIEALGQACPLVASEAGARGLEAGIGHAFLRGDTPDEFADAVLRILTDGELARRLSAEARKFACELQDRSLSDLRCALGLATSPSGAQTPSTANVHKS